MPILGAYKAVDLAQEYGESLPAGLAESLNLPLTEDAAEARYEELHNWGSERLESTIQELKGFYVKTGQVISTRVDLFPEQYTSRLASLQDDLDPMPTETVGVRGLGSAKLANFAKFCKILQNFANFCKFLAGSFSAVSKRNFARKYAFDSIFQALQDLHPFAPLQSQNFRKKSV